MDIQATLDRYEQRIATLERKLKTAEHGAIEEHEGALCPEDMGCREYIAALQQQIATLRKALIGLVGASAPDELDAMELVLRASEIPAADTAAAIDAIHALKATSREV
jgi:hypothetical protein